MVPLGLALILPSGTRADTALVAWGSHWDGDQGAYVPVTVPANLTNVIAVAAGFQHYVCLSRNGKATGVAHTWDAQANIPPGATNPIAFATGYYDSDRSSRPRAWVERTNGPSLGCHQYSRDFTWAAVRAGAEERRRCCIVGG